MTHLTTHESICDTAHRLIQGIDTNTPSFISSAFTENSTWEFHNFSFLRDYNEPLIGRDHIVSALVAATGKMETTHMLSNFRTEVAENGDEAKMTCYALAQHWRPGQGQSWIFDKCFLMGNRYETELVKDAGDGVWRFKRFVLSCVWSQGDAGVMDRGSWERAERSVRDAVAVMDAQ